MRYRLTTIALAALACSSDRGAPAGDVGGTLVIAMPAEPVTFMPTHLRFAHEKQIADQIFDVLAEIGPGLSTQGDAGWKPRLARSWEWSRDSLSIAFRLHPEARWHDGVPVTARDVRFSIDLYRDPTVGSRFASSFADVDSVSTPDSLTAVIWYAKRSPEQFYNVAYTLLLMPEHLLRDADRADLVSHPFGRQPVGSGPFRFVRWEARTVVEVAADTAYQLGRPLLDRVIWTLNPDPNTALVKVVAGEADMFETLTPDGLAQIGGHAEVQAVHYTNVNYGYLGFNMRDPADSTRAHPLFQDVSLRRAIAMAIDRQALVKNVYDTLAWVGAGPFSRSLATADTTLRMVPFDSAAAGRLLDSLGWRDRNGDGVRERNGRPLRFGVSYPSSSTPRRRFAELIQAQLRPHGVQVDVDAIDVMAFGARLYGGKFDSFVNNWLPDPTPSAIASTWRSVTLDNRASNFQLYGNAAVDAAIDSAMTVVNPEQSRALYRRAYQLIMEDVPAVWLYEIKGHMAVNRRVRPVVDGTDTWWRSLRLWSVAPPP